MIRCCRIRMAAVPSGGVGSQSAIRRIDLLDRSFSRSVLKTTRMASRLSNAWVNSSNLASVFAFVRRYAEVSQVPPISSRRCCGTISMYRVRPTTREVDLSNIVKGRVIPQRCSSSNAWTYSRISSAVSMGERNGLDLHVSDLCHVERSVTTRSPCE